MGRRSGVYVNVGDILRDENTGLVEVQVSYIDRGDGTVGFPVTLRDGNSDQEFPQSLQEYLDDLMKSANPLDKILAKAFVEAHQVAKDLAVQIADDFALDTEYEPGRPPSDYMDNSLRVYPTVVIDRAYVDKVMAVETASLGR